MRLMKNYLIQKLYDIKEDKIIFIFLIGPYIYFSYHIEEIWYQIPIKKVLSHIGSKPKWIFTIIMDILR